MRCERVLKYEVFHWRFWGRHEGRIRARVSVGVPRAGSSHAPQCGAAIVVVEVGIIELDAGIRSPSSILFVCHFDYPVVDNGGNSPRCSVKTHSIAHTRVWATGFALRSQRSLGLIRIGEQGQVGLGPCFLLAAEYVLVLGRWLCFL